MKTLTVHRPVGLPGIELWHWHFPPNQDVCLLTSSYMFGGPDREYSRDVRVDLHFGGRHHLATGCSRLFLEPGEVYRSRMVTDAAPPPAHVLHLSPSWMAHYVELDSPRGRSRLHSRLSNEPAVADAFERLCTVIERSADSMKQEHHLRAFLQLAFTRADDLPSRPPARSCARALRRVRELLQDRYAEELSLREIASVVDLSVYHLERSFAEKFGAPIHRYLLLVRIERSLAQLRAGTRPASAASACGFADQAHMTRVYRKWLGFTPGQYAGRTCGVACRG